MIFIANQIANLTVHELQHTRNTSVRVLTRVANQLPRILASGKRKRAQMEFRDINPPPQLPHVVRIRDDIDFSALPML